MRRFPQLLFILGLFLVLAVWSADWRSTAEYTDSQSALNRLLEESSDSWASGDRELPVEGSAIGRVLIPDLGLEHVIVLGVSGPTLRIGPGWVPFSESPGGSGNIAVAGHRTGWGSPFEDLDLLDDGASVTVEWFTGASETFEVASSEIVSPLEAHHMMPTPKGSEATLSLITCHPKGSLEKRLIVTANRVESKVPDAHREFLDLFQTEVGPVDFTETGHS